MADALVALGELSKLFLDQFKMYDLLAGYLVNNSGSTEDDTILSARKAFVMHFLNKALS
jgi:hypothetical protein